MTTPSPSNTKILATYNNHGSYVRHLGNIYFLAAAELHERLEPGTTWDDPQAQVRAVTHLITEIERDPRAMTSLGSFCFDDKDEYRRHRRSLARVISVFRRALELNQKVQALASAG